jgi:pyruvate/2-oxoglutarate dehydrogenase complex dihydrolipoamide dehydrogenase (E3) component
MNDKRIFDCIIIGAGPGGLQTIIAAGEGAAAAIDLKKRLLEI